MDLMVPRTTSPTLIWQPAKFQGVFEGAFPSHRGNTTVRGRLSISLIRSLMRGPNNFALYASELSIEMTWPICSLISRRKLHLS